VLWHLGHRGSSRDSITYIMHRGHPARIIGTPTPASGLPSDDTHELGGDAVDDDDDDSLLGEPPPPTGFADDGPPAPPRDRDRLRRRSCSLDTLPLFLLIFPLFLPQLLWTGPFFTILHSATTELPYLAWSVVVEEAELARTRRHGGILLDRKFGTQLDPVPGYLWCRGATPVCVI
jgi:hypothetical protein